MPGPESPVDEHLVTVWAKDGSAIKLFRAGKGLRIEAPDHEVSLPRASAQQFVSLFSLLESLGDSVEFPEDEEVL